MKKLTAVVIALCFISITAQQRIPLIEEFSSSTCPPCKTFNDSTFKPFLKNASLAGKYTVVNYRMYWPGTGDPYNTAEGNSRKTVYGVGFVPDCYAVVVWVQISGTREVLQSAWSTVTTAVECRPVFNAAQAVPHIRNMTAYNVKNASISVHDLSGRQVAMIQPATSTFDLSKAGLSKGCYVVRIAGNKAVFSQRATITR